MLVQTRLLTLRSLRSFAGKERLRLARRMRERRDAQRILESGLFDRDFYRSQYPDVGASGLDPVRHYLRSGADEGRNPSELFDTRFYAERNPQVVASGANPLVHFICQGASEGCDPNPGFDMIRYFEDNPFVRRSGLNPLLHYARVGARFGRRPGRWLAPAYRCATHPDASLRPEVVS